MKRKLALFMAAIMALTVVPAISVFGANTVSITTGRYINQKEGVFDGSSVEKGLLYFLDIVLDEDVPAGEQFRAELVGATFAGVEKGNNDCFSYFEHVAEDEVANPNIYLSGYLPGAAADNNGDAVADFDHDGPWIPLSRNLSSGDSGGGYAAIVAGADAETVTMVVTALKKDYELLIAENNLIATEIQQLKDALMAEDGEASSNSKDELLELRDSKISEQKAVRNKMSEIYAKIKALDNTYPPTVIYTPPASSSQAVAAIFSVANAGTTTNSASMTRTIWSNMYYEGNKGASVDSGIVYVKKTGDSRIQVTVMADIIASPSSNKVIRLPLPMAINADAEVVEFNITTTSGYITKKQYVLIGEDTAPLVFNDSPSYNITSLRVGSPVHNETIYRGVSGGKAPYTFRQVGLPAGITIDASTGIISGTPLIANSVPGTATIYVKDSLNNEKYIEITFAEVRAASTNSGNNNNSNNNSGSGSSRAPSRPTVQANEGEAEVSYSLAGAGKEVDLSLPSSKVTEIINNAKDNKVEFNLSEVSNATNVSLSKSALAQLADAELGLKVELPQGIIELDAGAAQSAAEAMAASTADVAVALEKVEASTLTEVRRQALNDGDSLFSIKVSSGSDEIHQFNGTITVTVPYSGPLPMAVWYLNEAGQREKMNSVYDEATGMVSFTTEHLSDYVVGFDDEAEEPVPEPESIPVPDMPEVPLNPFTDVAADAVYIDDIVYVYEQGLMSGTNLSPMTFSPDEGLTRGMFVAILYRQAGSPDVSGIENTFSDIASEYYADAVKWAAKNNIVAGSGGKFLPRDIIKRQELAAILLRYMDYLKVNIVMTQEYILFADEADISAYAKNAAQIMTKLDVIEKTDSGAINPKGEVTRAQAAASLHRFINAIEK